jgi:hypothetical protein
MKGTIYRPVLCSTTLVADNIRVLNTAIAELLQVGWVVSYVEEFEDGACKAVLTNTWQVSETIPDTDAPEISAAEVYAAKNSLPETAQIPR